MTTICDDLCVLELGAGSVPASLAGMVLADHGARVLKVEPPEGDRLRAVHPSAALVWNRGKESVIADLRTRDGQEEVRELARNADVVIEAFSPGRADKWGIGADALRSENPGLVYCAISGFGANGPYAAPQGLRGPGVCEGWPLLRVVSSHRAADRPCSRRTSVASARPC